MPRMAYLTFAATDARQLNQPPFTQSSWVT